jgi:hypothetical protein
MQKNRNFISSFKGFMTTAFLCVLLLTGCSDEGLLPSPAIETIESDLSTTSLSLTGCNCKYTVPVTTGTSTVDGAALGIKPGDIICLKGGSTYGNIVFKNIKGSSTAPVKIMNCGGNVTINATGKPYGIKTMYSSFLRITGGSGTTYGIKINGGHQSVTLESLTTNIEVDHLEIGNSGFAGIMAKTDPTCDNATIRGNFVMKDVKLHDNYVHDTGGEGFYVGHSYWTKGVSTSCGTRYPHALEGVKIYNNVVKNSGWEAIQVGSTPTGAEVYNNRIENYGVKNVEYQNHGVQFGEGAPGKFYGNFIKGGKGNGLIIMGNAENFIHDNVIVSTGMDGIFIEDRTTGPGFKVINNTIINPGTNGIRLYSDLVSKNEVYNNIIVNPGSYTKYTYPRSGNDAYVYLLNKTMPIKMMNNHFTRDINSVKFVNYSANNYALSSSSPVIGKGTNISIFNITLDYAKKPRLSGLTYDIGAYEYQ